MSNFRINRPVGVPGQIGMKTGQDIKAEWSVLQTPPGKEVRIKATVLKPIPPNFGKMATITVFQELGGQRKACGAPLSAPVINGKIDLRWISSGSGTYHFEVRFAVFYGRTAKDEALNVSNSPVNNYHRDFFQR